MIINTSAKAGGGGALPPIDTTVTSGSSNLVTSGAVYTAISNSKSYCLDAIQNKSTSKNISITVSNTSLKSVAYYTTLQGGGAVQTKNSEALFIQSNVGLKHVLSSAPYYTAGNYLRYFNPSSENRMNIYCSTNANVANPLINQTILMTANTPRTAVLVNGKKGVFVSVTPTGNKMEIPNTTYHGDSGSPTFHMHYCDGFTTYYEMKITGSATGYIGYTYYNEMYDEEQETTYNCTLFSDTSSGSFNVSVLDSK